MSQWSAVDCPVASCSNEPQHGQNLSQIDGKRYTALGMIRVPSQCSGIRVRLLCQLFVSTSWSAKVELHDRDNWYSSQRVGMSSKSMSRPLRIVASILVELDPCVCLAYAKIRRYCQNIQRETATLFSSVERSLLVGRSSVYSPIQNTCE